MGACVVCVTDRAAHVQHGGEHLQMRGGGMPVHITSSCTFTGACLCIRLLHAVSHEGWGHAFAYYFFMQFHMRDGEVRGDARRCEEMRGDARR